MRRKNSDKDKDRPELIAPLEIHAGLIITLVYVRIGMTLATVLLETLVYIFMIEATIKLAGNRKRTLKKCKSKDGEELLIPN